MLYLLFFQLFCAASAILYLLKKRRLKELLTDSDIALLLAVYVSATFQILLLKNHSAVHEFSMMKEGFCVAMTAPLAAIILPRAFRSEGGVKFLGRQIDPLFTTWLLCFFLLVLITGIPTSTSRYIVSRDGEQDYSLATFIRGNTDRDDVCFSFTREIPYEPPQELTVSHKRIWQIVTAEEIDEMFPELPETAHKLLLIEKEPEEKIPDDIRMVEDALSEGQTVRAENDSYRLIVLSQS